MPYPFPEQLTQTASENERRLWDCLFRTIERLNLSEEELRALISDATKALQAAAAPIVINRGGGSREHLLPFGSVTGNTSSSAKTATVPGVTELKDGVACYIVNDTTATASGWTLNVNGLGAKNVYNSQGGARITTTYGKSYCMLFIYNEARDNGGGGWDMYYGYDSNTNTLAYQVRTNRNERTVADRLARYQICFTGTDANSMILPAALIPSGSYNTGTNKTLNTREFDPRRPIFYYSGTTNVPANTQPGGSTLWRQHDTVDMRYSFNVSSLIACMPVYVRCSPTSGGFLTLDGNDCLVQALPGTADGKVYLYLGMAFTSDSKNYLMELDPEHPCYEYSSGALRPWNG